MITLKVDFNNRARDGLVRARIRNDDEAPTPGDRVLAEDPAEGMLFEAVVREVNDSKTRAYLEIDWVPATAEPHSAPSGTFGFALISAAFSGWGVTTSFGGRPASPGYHPDTARNQQPRHGTWAANSGATARV